MKAALVLAAIFGMALCDQAPFNYMDLDFTVNDKRSTVWLREASKVTSTQWRREELMAADIGPNMTTLLVEDEDGNIRVEDLVNVEPYLQTSPADVTYYYYSQKHPNNPVKVTADDISPLIKSDFDIKRETFFIIHGWKNSYESEVNKLTKKAILDKQNVNLFAVDWSPIASRNYVSARWAVSDVGKYVADFIKTLAANGLQISRVAIAGHSLGAHVSGNAGSALRGQVDRIVGMDPALPLFSLTSTDGRLDPSDAKFVQVIHTCGGRLGFLAAIGHSDYYPNGGAIQNGCGLDITGTCAHSRAYMYFAESVSLPNGRSFTARQCSSYSDFKNGKCNNNPRSNMGGYEIDKGSRGLYYLRTNGQTPFAQG
ncbi:hypothetical protein NQ317_008582 [Molorchus minor]|uniref:Lipase domain-containing protein n=1 Tax=Molorchus minor TaxID=1323400 RepID=A0ABQ9J4G7_9CUCU|nr:hypothetical protein NQ317_008582 [Molorchus minor]